MRIKFLLTLLALNGLFWGISSEKAKATPIEDSDRQITNLSHNIAQLLNLDSTNRSLVKVAIDRALIAQTLGDCKNQTITNTGAPVKDVNPADKPKVTPNKTTEAPIQSIGQAKNKVATPETPPVRRRIMGARG
jgi:hypothetical protein